MKTIALLLAVLLVPCFSDARPNRAPGAASVAEQIALDRARHEANTASTPEARENARRRYRDEAARMDAERRHREQMARLEELERQMREIERENERRRRGY
jgi:hypothetical protein